MNTEPVMVAAADVIRTFGHGGTAVHALRSVSFDIPQGQLTALSGRSGSGKTRPAPGIRELACDLLLRVGGTRFEPVTSSVSGRSAGWLGVPANARKSTSPGRTLPQSAWRDSQICREWLPLVAPPLASRLCSSCAVQVPEQTVKPVLRLLPAGVSNTPLPTLTS
jgi:hypothetical protein